MLWYGQVWLYAEWSDVVWPGSHRVAWLVNTAVWSNVVECRSVVWSGSQLQVKHRGLVGWLEGAVVAPRGAGSTHHLQPNHHSADGIAEDLEIN